MTVNHGYAAAPSAAKAYPGTPHFIELHCGPRISPPTAFRTGSQLQVIFVFVVDTSGSMNGDKLATVQESIRQLYDQLRDNDILGIVTFDTNVRSVLGATAGRPAAEKLMNIIYGLHAYGARISTSACSSASTRSAATPESARTWSTASTCSLIDPTSGETNWIRIRANIAARLRGT